MEVRVFLNNRSDWLARFERIWTEQCQALGITSTLVTAHDPAPPVSGVALYFAQGTPALSEQESQRLREYLEAGWVVMPVVEHAALAGAELPELLKTRNAFLVDRYPEEDWATALVDEVLSSAWLARTARRIFISYRRTDSEAIAQQLHQHFIELGLDVFLDDCSIRHGVDFQRELKWWLNDADLTLLLVSPHLEQSRWVTEEIAFARNAGIGFVGVLWPESLYASSGQAEPGVTRTLMEDEQYRLSPSAVTSTAGPPATQTLGQDAVDGITARVLLRRAQAIHRRMHNLLPFAQSELERKYTLVDKPRLGDLLLKERDSGRELLVRVFPFRPSLHTLHTLHQEAARAPTPPYSVGCFYEENDPRDERVKAMHWVLDAERPLSKPSRHLLWPFDGRRLS